MHKLPNLYRTGWALRNPPWRRKPPSPSPWRGRAERSRWWIGRKPSAGLRQSAGTPRHSTRRAGQQRQALRGQAALWGGERYGKFAERTVIPPPPKAPQKSSSMAAEAANVLGSALGIDTAHQREVKAHQEAMRQWREKAKQLRQQDAAAWEHMRARAAVALLRLPQRSEVKQQR